MDAETLTMSLCRWVYLIEGAFSLVCALAIWFGMPSDVRKAYFLNEEERKVMQIRHVERLAYMGEDKLSWEEIRLAFTDMKVWLSYVHRHLAS